MKKFIQDLLSYNYEKNQIKYVEPFAGGAGLGLSLLYEDYVSEIYINDFDSTIYALWYSILFHTDELIDLIYRTPITIENWHEQKQIRIQKHHHSILEIGFSTFFLNRTNVSGIINGGPIGGREQKNKYKLDCRYNKKNLVNKIKKISSYADKIHLTNKDAEFFILEDIQNLNPSETFIFFDPPYYEQGQNLYANYYNHDNHVDLGNRIMNLTNYKWITTYDNNVNIKNIYQGFPYQLYSLNYSANKVRKAHELLYYSPLISLPNSNYIHFFDIVTN